MEERLFVEGAARCYTSVQHVRGMSPKRAEGVVTRGRAAAVNRDGESQAEAEALIPQVSL